MSAGAVVQDFKKDFAEASSQLTQSLSQLRAIEALKKNIKRKK